MKMMMGKIRDSGDKLFLLALFLLGLAVAHGMVSWYQRIRLSEPILLGTTGLAVPMPADEGWQTPTAWGISSLGPILRARLTLPSLSAEVVCLYRKTDESINTREQLITEVEKEGYQVSDFGEIEVGRSRMMWIEAETPKTYNTIFFGVAGLSHSAALQLTVTSQDPELARRIFMSIAEKIRYRPPMVPDEKGLTQRNWTPSHQERAGHG
ncbi:MAG: hypothetical protein JW828_04125 [Sedimentisphaerales bacterium]|nr:hypothetical protein [Sedimentisphaerales bacterium]